MNTIGKGLLSRSYLAGIKMPGESICFVTKLTCNGFSVAFLLKKKKDH